VTFGVVAFADRWTVTLREHAEPGAGVYSMISRKRP